MSLLVLEDEGISGSILLYVTQVGQGLGHILEPIEKDCKRVSLMSLALDSIVEAKG